MNSSEDNLKLNRWKRMTNFWENFKKLKLSLIKLNLFENK